MSQNDYQQGFYDGVTKVRKLLEDDAAEAKELSQDECQRAVAMYRLVILREISDLLHPEPAV